MADKTFGVKVSEELHDRVKQLIEESGETSKEWFEKAVQLTEMQSVKEGATEHRQDLNELEVHTARIYELVANMVQRSIYIKEHAVKEITEKLEGKELIIADYQERTNNAIEDLKIMQEKLQATEKINNELNKQLEGLQANNENNQLLIDEYKGKNDTLSGLVAKYQEYADENEQLNDQLREITSENSKQASRLKELEKLMESEKESNALELERLNEKKDYEKDKAILEVERELQNKLIKANEQYNDKIAQLYEEMNELRKNHDGKNE